MSSCLCSMFPVSLKSRVYEFLVSSFLAPCSPRVVTEGQTKTVTFVCVHLCFCFLLSVFSFRCVPMDPLVRPEFLLLLLEQGDRSLEDHTRLFLLLANTTSYPDDALCSWCKPEHREQSAVVRRWSLRGIRHLRGVDSGEKRIAPHRLSWGWSRQIHSRPSAQPTISPLRRAHAWAHHWRRARARRDRRAIAAQSDRATDRPGAAYDVRSGARACDCAHHEGASRGRCERGVKLRPLHHGWGWAVNTSGTARHGAGSDRLGCCSGDWTAPSPLSIVRACSVQPSFVLDSLVQPWGGFRSSSARSSEVAFSSHS